MRFWSTENPEKLLRNDVTSWASAENSLCRKFVFIIRLESKVMKNIVTSLIVRNQKHFNAGTPHKRNVCVFYYTILLIPGILLHIPQAKKCSSALEIATAARQLDQILPAASIKRNNCESRTHPLIENIFLCAREKNSSLWQQGKSASKGLNYPFFASKLERNCPTRFTFHSSARPIKVLPWKLFLPAEEM